MAAREGSREAEEFVYRISTAKEWEELQKSGTTFGSELDNKSGFLHFSNLNQVRSTLENFFTNPEKVNCVKPVLQNFFANTDEELYLLQIDTKKLGDGLVYEVVDGTDAFPHFYGPSRSFSPLPLDAVTKTEKIIVSDGHFSCCLLD